MLVSIETVLGIALCQTEIYGIQQIGYVQLYYSIVDSQYINTVGSTVTIVLHVRIK